MQHLRRLQDGARMGVGVSVDPIELVLAESGCGGAADDRTARAGAGQAQRVKAPMSFSHASLKASSAAMRNFDNLVVAANRSGIDAVGSSSTRPATLSGWRTANISATIPPADHPAITAGV